MHGTAEQRRRTPGSAPEEAVVDLLQPQKVPVAQQALRRPLPLVQVCQRPRRLQENSHK